MTRKSAMTIRWRAAAVLSAALGMAACATDVPPPTAQLGAASQAVQEAERANALQYAPVALQSARDKLAAADKAMRADERTRARRLAEEARVDAELATVTSQRAVTQQAASAVAKSAVPNTPRSAAAPNVAPVYSGSTLGGTPPAGGSSDGDSNLSGSSYAAPPAVPSAPAGSLGTINGTSGGNSWGYSYPEVRQ
ncbi:hypothetical protein J2848_001500 [Azospirillum lipoferum]|uniref:DUF4398 domain-containing protein n=1 Tax=Azospirillum lipoferum TaxID=193 RepID=A0A5A9GU57_AZOLI|nr:MULTISPECIES: DUF4398 domain-containing protein [Azospirillum]KAA0598011.1 DUF4398 domain-containing protein [Azospirillum lipoferum]MCP1609841.1 hypothetical protein [Azospirillum lipoferum]MDW5534666.1 DUF4398 domain-containing protein [Azospirillum sp. NL1]